MGLNLSKHADLYGRGGRFSGEADLGASPGLIYTRDSRFKILYFLYGPFWGMEEYTRIQEKNIDTQLITGTRSHAHLR